MGKEHSTDTKSTSRFPNSPVEEALRNIAMSGRTVSDGLDLGTELQRAHIAFQGMFDTVAALSGLDVHRKDIRAGFDSALLTFAAGTMIRGYELGQHSLGQENSRSE